MFKISNRDTEKLWLAKENVLANIAERQQRRFNNYGTKKANIATTDVQQIQINPKYNKNTTLITSLSSLHIWEQRRFQK